MTRKLITDLHPLVSHGKLEALLGRDRSDYCRLAGHAGRYYNSFDMRRVGKEKWRHIDNPRGELKVIQARIQRTILSTARLPQCMLGSVPGFSIKDNLRKHKAPDFLLTLDLKECFPRTSHRAVYRIYREWFGCSAELANVLTKLTSLEHRLPQGSPASPTLANLSLIKLARRLEDLARQLELELSLWVDDIAFSGARAREVIEPAVTTIMEFGHAVRRSKIKRMPRGVRQEVTGGVVTPHGFSAGRRARVQPLRQKIVRLSAKSELNESELRSIDGSIGQIAWLSPTQGATLRSLAQRLLPAASASGKGVRKLETRPCSAAKRHASRPRKTAAKQSPDVGSKISGAETIESRVHQECTTGVQRSLAT